MERERLSLEISGLTAEELSLIPRPLMLESAFGRYERRFILRRETLIIERSWSRAATPPKDSSERLVARRFFARVERAEHEPLVGCRSGTADPHRSDTVSGLDDLSLEVATDPDQ